MGADVLEKATTFSSGFGVLAAENIRIDNDDEVFAVIELSGFNDPENQSRSLIDDDGFFSLALAVHAFLNNSALKSGNSPINLRQFSQNALCYLAPMIDAYIEEERAEFLNILKDRLKDVVDMTPLDRELADNLLDKIQQAETAYSILEDQLEHTEKLLDKNEGLSEAKN